MWTQMCYEEVTTKLYVYVLMSFREVCTTTAATTTESPVSQSEMPLEMAHVDFLDGLDITMIGDKVRN